MLRPQAAEGGHWRHETAPRRQRAEKNKWGSSLLEIVTTTGTPRASSFYRERISVS
jgi:hypothetical protein